MGVVDLVFPKRCGGCKKEGEFICKECQRKLWKPKPICPRCGTISKDGWTHKRCWESEGMERLIVGLPYKGLVQKCLKSVKYKSSWAIIESMYRLGRLPKLKGAVVTSVPMWRGKERERGFNQAEIIAKMLAKTNRLRHLRMLLRERGTKAMYGLNKQERGENVRGAFQVVKDLEIPKRVILVDDVWTTGATMRECTRELKKGGVKEVWGAVLAR